jgi:hypothetical protein
MMSYNPFEKFNDALFHEFGNEKNYQRNLDEFYLAGVLNKTLIYVFPFEDNEFL